MKKRIIALVASVLMIAVCVILLGQLTRPKYTDNPEGALIGEYYASSKLAEEELGFKATKTLSDMCKSSYEYQKNNKKK